MLKDRFYGLTAAIALATCPLLTACTQNRPPPPIMESGGFPGAAYDEVVKWYGKFIEQPKIKDIPKLTDLMVTQAERFGTRHSYTSVLKLPELTLRES